MSSHTLCPRFHRAIELIGGRWTGPILQLLMGRRARFAGLRDAIPNISDRMLSERLRELGAEGLVARTVIPDPPIRVEYALTDKGREVRDTVEALYQKHARTVEQVGGINADEFGVLNKALHRLERFWTDQILYRL